MRKASLALLWGLGLLAGKTWGGDILMVGDRLGEVGVVARRLGLPVRLIGRLTTPSLESAEAVIVRADGYPQPAVLSRSEWRALEGFVRRGGRAYLEFTVWDGAFGLTTQPQPDRFLHERLVAEASHPATQYLPPAALLDEHGAAALRFGKLPPGFQTILRYEKALGTYTRIDPPDPSLFSVTVDLGRSVPIFGVRQHYGAGQPNYHPEKVTLSLSEEGKQFQEAATQGGLEGSLGPVVEFEVGGRRARFVRLTAQKFRRSPVTDFLFMGEVEVLDGSGQNLAQGRSYTLQAQSDPVGPYADDGQKLTDGVIEGHYTDHLSVGWLTPPLPDPAFPALASLRLGRGEVLVATTPLSDFRRLRFRPTRFWEDLWRGILLTLLPESKREAAAARYVPLRAYTQPREWVVPREPVKLRVETGPGTKIRVIGSRLDSAFSPSGRSVVLKEVSPGLFETNLRLGPGLYLWRVQAWTRRGRAWAEVQLEVRSRAEKYRQALDANMRWFRRSGVLPHPDGRAGVKSQVCLAWLDGGFQDPLGCDFRVDCNAMSAEAFYLYGLLTGDATWKRIGVNVADTVLAHQYRETGRASLGAWPWLYCRNESIFFWDDQSRTAQALLWLYHWTGEERFLRAALLNAELQRQCARSDGVVWRHCIGRTELDREGRSRYRAYSQGPGGVEERLYQWWTLWALTGDASFRQLAEAVTDIYGPSASLLGGAFAAYYSQNPALRDRLIRLCREYLQIPDVQRMGVVRGGGGDYRAAFVGDCGIATAADEPLTDQLYLTSWQFLGAYGAWRATGDEACRRACEAIGDYLVRIQCQDRDPRLNGCWMRGFDFEHWETFGAPYDPAYGPYSAYTGWMNAIIARALAFYLLQLEPFIPPYQNPSRPRQVLAEVRAQNPEPDEVLANVARGCPYTLAGLAPSPAYGDDGRKLTDGIVDGAYPDRQSVGFHLPEEGKVYTVQMRLDLGQERTIRRITQRYGALMGGYNPDRVVVSVSPDGRTFEPVGEANFGRQYAQMLYLVLDPPRLGRMVQFEFQKTRRDLLTDYLFIGETEVGEALQRWQ